MGISINAPGSVSNQASMTGTLSIRKSTNTFEQMAGVSSSGGTSKKQLNYNHRDISGQLLRAKKPQSASAALTRAKSKVSMLQRAAASGQYDSKEVADALAHARRMVRCAQLKVRNLREEEREQQSVQKENSGKSQQKEHEVKRRVAQKERQLKQKVAIENTQEVLRQKKKKNEMAQKQQRHRSQERGKIAEADFKYIKSQLEAGKGFGGGSSYCGGRGGSGSGDVTYRRRNAYSCDRGSRAGRYRSGNCIGHSASRCRRICGCVSVRNRRKGLDALSGQPLLMC